MSRCPFARSLIAALLLLVMAMPGGAMTAAPAMAAGSSTPTATAGAAGTATMSVSSQAPSPSRAAARRTTVRLARKGKGQSGGGVIAADSPTTTEYAGSPFNFTLQILNSDGSVDTGYTGTVHFSSSDPAASLPPDYTYTTGPGGDNGVHTFQITFQTLGAQSITITGTDLGTGTVNYQVNAVVFTAAWSTGYTWPGYSVPLVLRATDGSGNLVNYSGTLQFSSSINGGSVFYTDTWNNIAGSTYFIVFNTNAPPQYPTVTVSDQTYPSRTVTSAAVTVWWENCSGPTFNFAGAQAAIYSQSGVAADISTQNIPLCDNFQGSDTSDSSTWVMESANTDEYAQVGYGRARSSSQQPQYFWQWRNGPSSFDTNYITIGGSTLASGTHHYSVQYDFTGHVLDMAIDGVTYASTPFDPEQAWQGIGTPDWAGETHDNGDNVAGTLANPVYFSNMQIRGPNQGDGWSRPSSASLYSQQPTNPARYHTAWDSQNSQFHMWTQDN